MLNRDDFDRSMGNPDHSVDALRYAFLPQTHKVSIRGTLGARWFQCKEWMKAQWEKWKSIDWLQLLLTDLSHKKQTGVFSEDVRMDLRNTLYERDVDTFLRQFVDDYRQQVAQQILIALLNEVVDIFAERTERSATINRNMQFLIGICWGSILGLYAVLLSHFLFH